MNVFKLLSVTLMSLMFSMSVSAQPEYTFRMHHLLPPMSEVHTLMLLPWAERIENESKGRIKIEVFPAMQLGGKPPQLYDQARKNVVQISWTVAGYTPGRFKKAEVFELPFMAAQAEVTSQAIQTFAEQEMAKDFKGVKLLAIHTNATGVLHSRDKAIRSIADLKGMKIRAPNRVIADAYKPLGITPIFLPAPQIPPALSKGVIDAASLSYDIVGATKLHELASSHTELNLDGRGIYAQVFLFVMNKKAYDELPADLKGVIDRNSGLSLAKEFGRQLDEMGARGKALALSNNPIYQLNEADMATIKQKSTPVTEHWIKQMNEEGIDGEALYRKANSLIEQYESH